MTSTHNKLIYGAIAAVNFTPSNTKKAKFRPELAKLLTSFAMNGYVITNSHELTTLGKRDIVALSAQIVEMITSTTKQAFFLRKTFGTTTQLENYSIEDWKAIIAQYHLTYGCKSLFSAAKASQILSEYVGDAFEDTHSFPEKVKEITVMLPATHQEYIASILTSKVPLRAHQEQIIQTTDYSNFNAEGLKFAIKSTKALMQNTQYKQGLTPTISNLDEMQRFILSNCQKGDNGEDYTGQILNPMLKTFKFHIPTKMKKFILDWFNREKTISKEMQLVEAMYSNESWWKRMFLHAHWCNKAKFTKRYQLTSNLLARLYSEDRSWTFNSRYTAAQNAGDYSKAIEILAEKPGLLMRNLVMYCKYTVGVKLPVKEGGKSTVKTKVVVNPLTNMLSHKKSKVIPASSTGADRVLTDASDFIRSNFRTLLIKNNPPIKTAWQLIETLLEEAHEKPISVRTVQGVTVRYSTPIPAINKALRDLVIHIVMDYIRETKAKANKSLGKVYLEPELDGIALQYSGANSNEISMSGCFLTPGTVLPMPEGDFIRMGVVWRDVGAGSCDIDLSTTLATATSNYTCYYDSPQTKIGGKLVATSSGDITSCGTSRYSAEFIDIDIKQAKAVGVKTLFNSLVVYSGSRNIGSYDTHAFISVIDATDRVSSGRNIEIDLGKQDYAVKLTDDVSGYLGFSLDLDNMSMKSLAIGSNTLARGSNAINALEEFADQVKAQPARLNMLVALKASIRADQLTTDKSKADTVIGISSDATFNVVKHGEDIQQVIF